MPSITSLITEPAIMERDGFQWGDIERERRKAYVAGLRQLANLIEEDQPDDEGRHALYLSEFDNTSFSVWAGSADEAVALMRRVGGEWEKRADTYSFQFVRRMHPDALAYASRKEGDERPKPAMVELHIQCSREQVCERKVVGTETKVVKKVPDEKAEEAQALRDKLAAMEVEVPTEVEKIEWDCAPVLARVKGGE